MERRIYILLICINVIYCQDPCTIHQQMNDPTRSVGYTLGSSEAEGCDRLIAEDWYKFQDDANMPTECPPVLRCGSTGPIWINGSLPVANNELTLTVCQVGFLGCCEFNWQIRVRNCGTFNVFHLISTPACPGRYCAEGPPPPCQPGWGSETGFEPCTETNITFAVTPHVEPYIPTFDPTSIHNQLAFECSTYYMDIAYQSFIFDIRWSIDGKVVATKNQIAFSDMKSQGSLHRVDWDPQRNKQIGIRVACSIRARAFIGAPPTEYNSSKEFFAGAMVQATTINVQSGQSAEILIKSTVPIACRIILGTTRCSVRMELFSFADQFDQNEERHCNQSLTDKVKPSACGLEFDGVNWFQYQTVSVSALADQTSRQSYTALVKLRAISGGDTLWANYFLPDITVNVFSVQRPSGYCGSWTDPAITTVDGNYFTSLATGEFVLYKVKNKPIEVHTIQSSEGVNCAIAVRAASDVFIVYGCGKTKQWIIRRLNCNAQTQYLKVFERNLGQMFEVFLPSGTRVEIYIQWTSWLNINIFPSPTDWNQTEGKCGTYNGDWSDDFTDRNGNVVGVDDFIRSWSVTQTESLFIAKIRDEILKIPFFYCSCIEDEFPSGDVTEKADCSWEESLPSCQPLNWGQKECQIQRKREALDDFEIDVPEDMIKFEESTLSTNWKNGWNETIARQTCESALFKSPIYKECSSLQNVGNENNIESCIIDIKVSGTDTFLDDVRERMKTKCISELRYNASLWVNTTETSESSLIDAVYDNDCPNDCSSSGTCTKGKCVCNPSFIGDDCSINSDIPPILSDVSEESLCDLSKRPCISTSIFGQGFFASHTITCNLTTAKFLGSTIVKGNSSSTVTGNLESFGEVKCPILEPMKKRRKRSTTNNTVPHVILVSVSMDGSKFSSAVPIVIFNSSCSSCNITGNTVTCDIRGDICIKNGECFDMTNANCATSNIVPVKHPDASLYLIIGIVVGSVFVLAVIIMVIIKIYNHKRHCVKDIDEPNFSMGVTKVNGSAPVSHRATKQ